MKRALNIKCYYPGAAVRNSTLAERLTHSLVGHIYRHTFKKIPAIRAFIMWCSSGFFSLLFKMTNAILVCKKVVSSRPLIRQDEFTKDFCCPVVRLTDSVKVVTPLPFFFPPLDEGYLGSPQDFYEFPEIYVSEIKNAIVYGSSNLVVVPEGVIYHDLYNMEHDKTSEETKLRVQIFPKQKKILWASHDELPGYIEVAAAFLDACSHNYAHWTTEVLSRIAMFCSDSRFKDIPIIIDAGLHSNIIESLSYIIGLEREVIVLSPWNAIKIGKLYMTSVAGYITFERRATNLPWHTQGKFSPHALGLIREKLLQFADAEVNKLVPEKIYIKRATVIRSIVNADEVEKFLIDRGFTIIEPEKLTLLEQIRTYNQAKMIIGPTGAGLANIIYAAPTARILILMSRQHDNIYFYWQGMACACGNKVGFVLGEIVGKNIGIHSNFAINVNVLDGALAASDS